MRGKGAIVACIVALLAGCNPLAERRYVNEGAGVDLYTADAAAQVELLNAYTDFICTQLHAYSNFFFRKSVTSGQICAASFSLSVPSAL